MILFLRKNGDDQISVHLHFRGYHRKEIHKFQEWHPQDLENNPTVDEMTDVGYKPTRNFSRTCKNAIGISTIKHLEKIKIRTSQIFVDKFYLFE